MPIVFDKDTQLQHAVEKLELKEGLGLAATQGQKLVRTVRHDQHASLYLLVEQSEDLPYWCKVAFVVELHVGRAAQVQGWICQGQQHRNHVTTFINYTKK